MLEPARTPEDALRGNKESRIDATLGFRENSLRSTHKDTVIGQCAFKDFDNGKRLLRCCHAPYFISFNSESLETIDKSVQWVIDTATAAHHLGAYIIVIHAASYGAKRDEALPNVIKGLTECKNRLDDLSIKDVILGVETMGKQGQFGTLKEIAQVMDSVDGVRPVLDVAHVHARGVGCLKTAADMQNLIGEFFPLCGSVAHFHISCIKYGDKGEISHLPLSEKQPDLQMLADLLNDSRGLHVRL